MAPTPRTLPAHLGEAFRTTTAQGAGVTRRRLRAQDLEAPFVGVRQVRRVLDAPPRDEMPFARDRAQRDEVLRLARAYATVMPEGGFYAGRTALAFHALPIAHGAALEVAVFSPARAVRRRGVRGRRIDAGLAHVGRFEGMPVASPASAWAMLAAELSVRELIVLGDAIVHVPRNRFGDRAPERALATMEQLHLAVAAGVRPGRPRLRTALEAVCTESASPLETEFRLDANAGGLPRPDLDAEVHDMSGRRIGISEFVYRAWRVVVEIEGDHHRTERAQWARDLEKYAAYADAGWEVVRLAGAQVRRGTGVAVVRRALIRHGWQPSAR